MDNLKPAQSFQACSPGAYLELFARNQRPNWVQWGNQLKGDNAKSQHPDSLFSPLKGTRP
jgi:N6-adenosine-specific RNA methylase IME4